MRREHAREGEGQDGGVLAHFVVHLCVSLTSDEARKRRVAAHRVAGPPSRQRVEGEYGLITPGCKNLCPGSEHFFAKMEYDKALKALGNYSNFA